GAAGLTAATLSEAEVFVDAGAGDLFVAYPVIAQGQRARTLRELRERCRLAVGADSLDGLELLAEAVAGAAEPLHVLIEVDSGGGRSGVRADAVVALAEHAARLGLHVRGAFTHGGHGYASQEARDPAASDEVAALARAGALLREAGFEIEVLSAGSTPTVGSSARAPVTEERPGTYVFNDG